MTTIDTHAENPLYPKGGPTKEQAEAANAGKLAPYGLEKVLRSLAKSWAVRLGLASAASIGAYEYVPAVHEFVDSQYHNLLQTIGQETAPVPLTFDNKVEQQVIGDNNILRITPEEANKQDLLAPQFDLETKTVKMFTPFIIPTSTTATLDKSVYEIRTIKHNEPREIVPQGTRIIFPQGMHYRILGGDPKLNENPNLVYGISAMKYNEETNISVSLGFYLWDDREQKIVPLATHLPILPARTDFSNLEEYTTDYWEKNMPVSDGKTPIATTTTDQLIHVLISIVKGKNFYLAGTNGKEIKNVQIQWEQKGNKLLMLEPIQ